VIEPLVIELGVACSVEHAFATWTARFGAWWPRGHSVTGDPDTVVLEARRGGRIYERTRDGREIEWGEITEWDPPHRLVYRWHLRRDREDATDVEIRFLADGDATRVQITHRGWERLGAEAESWRDANRRGWGGVLPAFAAACTDPSNTTGAPT
jgi:uncharacterized protein YndB with AHSA1/START domain